MIGLEIPGEVGPVRKSLLHEQHIFTGASKPNVLRLLPPMNMTAQHANQFCESI